MFLEQRPDLRALLVVDPEFMGRQRTRTESKDPAVTGPGPAASLSIHLHCLVRAMAQLCRCITRSTRADERLQTNAGGQAVRQLKTASRDGTTHMVMSLLELMQRLAALVPSAAAAPDSVPRRAGPQGQAARAPARGQALQAA